MYRNKRHILYAKLLLLIFAAGQVVLFTHQHKIGKCCGEVSLAHYSKTGYHAHNPEIQNCLLCEVVINKKFLLNEFKTAKAYFTITHNPVVYFYETLYALKKLWKSRGPPLKGLCSITKIKQIILTKKLN